MIHQLAEEYHQTPSQFLGNLSSTEELVEIIAFRHIREERRVAAEQAKPQGKP